LRQFVRVAASVTMLLGVNAPLHGGGTLFADMIAAFEHLPVAERARLERLKVLHAVSAARPGADERIVRPQDLPPELSGDTAVPEPVVHPLVRRHPVTGSQALYGPGGSAFGIVGMSHADGAGLIEELKRHATRSLFVQSCKLLPRQIPMWDIFAVMHRATHIEYTDDSAQARLSYRASVKGGPPFMARRSP
jgi:taurine dioxygenase